METKHPNSQNNSIVDRSRSRPSRSRRCDYDHRSRTCHRGYKETRSPQGLSVQSETEMPKDPVLYPDLLEIIVKRLDIGKGPAIHNDIVVRWEEILKNVLPDNEQKELFKKYLTSINCVSDRTPQLNSEVKVTILEPIVNRDKRISEKREEVKGCLAALGTTLSKLFKGTYLNPLSIISSLSKIGRILVDLQHNETLTRHLIISANLNSSFKETLNATTADEWLVRKDLAEPLKAAKSWECSPLELNLIAIKRPSSASTSKLEKKGPRHQPSFQ